MTDKELLNKLKELQAAVLLQEAATRQTVQIAASIINELEGVSTSSKPRKGKKPLITEEELSEFMKGFFKSSFK